MLELPTIERDRTQIFDTRCLPHWGSELQGILQHEVDIGIQSLGLGSEGSRAGQRLEGEGHWLFKTLAEQ